MKKSVLVTGATRGIGEAVARGLVDHDLVVTARSADRLAGLAEELGCRWVEMDIADSASVAAGTARVVEIFGGTPQVLVNCAGVFDIAPITATSDATLDRNLDVNLRGPFYMVRAFLAGMLERGSGLVINIGSVAGRSAFPGNGAYSASKFGLRGLHEVMLEEIRGSGVRATLIEPGAVDTGIWDPLDPDADPGLPSREHMLQVGDVAEAVRFVVDRPGHVQIPLVQISRA